MGLGEVAIAALPTGICPKPAFSDSLGGAVYPEVDAAKCVDCKRCEAICPNLHALQRKRPKVCYAAWHLNNVEREASTSGGIGMAFSKSVVAHGGVVYGAAVTGAGTVEHIRVNGDDELHRLQKSKYVHSHVTVQTYRQLLADKKAGRLILFTGTPCQTAGVKSFLGEYDKLLLVDLVCHGVPPQQILKDHIRWKAKGEVTDFTTRDNDEFKLTLYDGQRQVVYQRSFPADEYEYGFMYGMFYRPNCYQCKYACTGRCSDVTIGDFWGLGETDYPKEKVSEILVNTEKGERLLALCEGSLFLEQRPVEEAVRGNAQLRTPSRKNYLHTIFFLLYPRFGYRAAIRAAYLKFRLMRPIYKLFKM